MTRRLKSESGIHSWLKPSLLRPSASTYSLRQFCGVQVFEMLR